MPWESKGGGNGGGPWGSDGNGSGGTGGTGGGGAGGPKNPWGPTPPPKPPSGNGPSGGKGSGNTPDFDDFIRKSQERLRASFNGGQGGGGGVRTAIPWTYIVVGLLALWIAFTSTYRVGPQERGIVQRFGRYVETTGPGLHFKLPAPIDAVQTPAVEAVTSTSVGAGEGAENLILTGDQNVINVAYTVRWKINDPVKYVFELAEPENTVKEVAESAMRSEVGRVSLDAAVGPQRAQIADQVRARTQELLTAYNSGIEVVGLDIRQADPPGAVDEAFKKVAAAQQAAKGYINNANAYAQEVVNKAQGETARFDQLYAQYKLAPDVTRRRLYYETMEDVLSRNATTVIEPRGVTPYLPVPPARTIEAPTIAPTKGAAK